LSSFKLFWETNFLPVQTDISTLVTKKLLRLDCEELVGVTWRVSDCEELVGVTHRRWWGCF